MNTDKRHTVSTIGQVILPARIVGMVTTSVLLLSYMYDLDRYEPRYYVHIGLMLVWPYLAFLLYKTRGKRRRQEHLNLLVDSLLVGVCITLLDFNFIPVLIIFLTTLINNLMVNGLKQVFYSAVLMLFAIVVSSFAFGYKVNEVDYWNVNVITFTSYFIFTLSYSAMIYRFSIRTRENKKMFVEKREVSEDQSVDIKWKNKELVEGIAYAKTIKAAFMPSENEFREIFPKSKIVSESKLDVGGNFYWFEKKDNIVNIIVGKCQRPGVSGSMFSLLNMNMFIDMFRKGGIAKEQIIPLFLSDFEKLLREKKSNVSQNLEILYAQIDVKENTLWATGCNGYLGIKDEGLNSVCNLPLTKDQVIVPYKEMKELDILNYKLMAGETIVLSIGALIRDSNQFNLVKEIDSDLINKLEDNCVVLAFEYS